MFRKNSVLLLLLLTAFSTIAQKGTYLIPFGAMQISTIANSSDFYIKGLNFKNVIRSAYGVGLLYNPIDMLGIETGLKYSNQGQKYTGHIDFDANTQDSINLDFTSECKLTYFQIPLLLRFNSTLEQDKVYMNISTGFQFDFLTAASMKVNPLPPDSLNLGSNVKKYFKSFNASFVASAGLNIQLAEKFFVYMGLQMSKTLGDIESKSISFDDKTMGFEYIYPVGVKKEERPQNSTTRGKTKNVVYTLLIGISYKLK